MSDLAWMHVIATNCKIADPEIIAMPFFSTMEMLKGVDMVQVRRALANRYKSQSHSSGNQCDIQRDMDAFEQLMNIYEKDLHLIMRIAQEKHLFVFDD